MSRISKVVSYGYKQTKAMSKTATKEVIGVAKLPVDIRTGYRTAKRLSDIKKLNCRQKSKTLGVGVIRKGITPHLPGILAGIGTVLPCFGTSALGLAVGKILQKAMKNI